MNTADLKLISFDAKQADSILKYLKYFRLEGQERSKELVATMPYQITKYKFKSFEIKQEYIRLQTILNQIEAIAIISFLLHCQSDIIFSALKGGYDLEKRFNLQADFRNKLKRVKDNYFEEMKVNINNESQMKGCIFLILLKINYFQFYQNIKPELGERNFKEIINAQVKFLEQSLGIRIAVSVNIKDNEKCQFISKSHPNFRPNMFILLNGKADQMQVQIIDYNSWIQEDLIISDSKLVRVFDNSDVFCTKSINNVWALLFLQNMSNRLTWRNKKKDSKLENIIDSYIFEAFVEAIEEIQKIEEYQYLWRPMVKIDQKVEMKWKDYFPLCIMFIGQVQNSPKTKLIEGFDLLGCNEVNLNQNTWYDGIVMSSKDEIKTVSFQKSTWKIGDPDQNSKIQELQFDNKADCISQFILNFMKNEVFPNQQGMSMQYSVFCLEDFEESTSFQLTYTIDVSSFYYLCLFCQNSENNELDQLQKPIGTDQNSYSNQLDKAKEVIQSFMVFLNNQKTQKNYVQIILENSELISCNNQKVFDFSMLESSGLKWINDLKQQFFQIGTPIEVIISSQNNDSEYLNQFYYNQPDILLDISFTKPVIYLKDKSYDSLNYFMNQHNQQNYNYLQQDYQDNSQQNTKNLEDLPEQLSLHNDLVWIIKDWNQVIAMFFLMNIKSQIFLKDNDSVDTTGYQISTNRLIMSPIFVKIVEYCKNLGIDQTNQLIWNITNQEISQQFLSELEQLFKNSNDSNNYLFKSNVDNNNNEQHMNQYYQAQISDPQNGQQQFMMEFSLISDIQNQPIHNLSSFCKECQLRIVTVNIQQMCSYCFIQSIQNSF